MGCAHAVGGRNHIIDPMTPNTTHVDLIGIFFILPPLFYPKKKDVPVDKVHPLLRVLLLQKRLWHIRLFRDTHLVGRANLVCSGT